MKIKLLSALLIAGCLGSISPAQHSEPLTAPTYYISLQAQHDYDNVVRVRGASNLPAGAKVLLQIVTMNGDAWQTYSEDVCVAIDNKGLFEQEISLSAGNQWRRDFFVRATFLTDECKQNANVLQVLGRHGQYLGHDNRQVTMDEVEMGMTPGMLANPQLFQVSGWYFGISTLARVEG